MRCQTAHHLMMKQLRETLDPRQTAQLTGHLQTCARCREEQAHMHLFEAHLPQVAPVTPISNDLSNQVRQAILAKRQPALRERKRRSPSMPLRVLGSLAATAAISFALLAFPHSHRTSSMAAEIAQALHAVNTYHLVGWKQIEGKRLSWEVWGRRSPFFYREQIGKELLVDDGKQCLRTFDADSQLKRQTNIVMRTPSRRNFSMIGDRFAPAFQEKKKLHKPIRETADEAVFAETGLDDMPELRAQDFYTVDKRSWLPTEYEERKSQNGLAPVTVASLRAEYGIGLPGGVTEDAFPPNAAIVDATIPPNDAHLPTDNVAQSGGVTAQLTPLAMDRSGTVLARIRAWLGSVPIQGKPFFMEVSPPLIIAKGVARNITGVDDAYHPYMMVPVDALRMMFAMRPGPDRLVLLAPAKPLHPGEALPRSLQAQLQLAPWVLQKMTGPDGNETRQMAILMDTTLQWTIALPQLTTDINLDAYLPSGWRPLVQSTNTPIPSIAQAVQEERKREAKHNTHL